MSTKRLSAVIQIGGAVASSLGTSLGGTVKKVNKLTAEIKKLGATQDKIKASESLEKSLKDDAQAATVLQAKIKALKTAFEAADGSGKHFAQDIDKAEMELKKLGTRIWENESQLSKYNSDLSRTGVNIHKLADEHTRLGRVLDKNKRKLDIRQARKDRLSSLQEEGGDLAGAMVGPAAILGVAKIATDQAREYEEELSNIRKTVGGTTDQINSLGESLRALSMREPISRTEVMEIGAMAGQAGIARNEIVQYTDDVIKLKIAFGMSGDQANDTLQSMRAALQLTEKQAMKLANTINVFGNDFQGVVSEARIAEFIQRQGATLMANGLKPGQIVALGSSLLAPGTATELAATAAKNMTNALTKGFAATKHQKKALGMLGLDPINVAKSMQKDAPKTIMAVLKAIQKQPKFQQSSIVSWLFGEESKGGIMPLLVNLKMLEDAFVKLRSAEADTTSLMNEFKSKMATTNASMAIFNNTTQDTTTRIGEGLNKSLGQTAQALQPVNKGMNEFIRQHPTATKVVADFTVTTALATAGMVAFRLGIIGVEAAATFLGISLGGPTLAILGLVGATAALILNFDKLAPQMESFANQVQRDFKNGLWGGYDPTTGGTKKFGAYDTAGYGYSGGAPSRQGPMVPGSMGWLKKPATNYTDNSQFQVIIHPAGVLDANELAKQVGKIHAAEQAKKRRKALHDGGR